MDKIAAGPASDRRDLFQESASRLGMNPAIVEKDFWVCWILRLLFAEPTLKDQMVFKGGTSLSKVFGLIDRFSEDIDLVLDWRLLGYHQEGAQVTERSFIRKPIAPARYSRHYYDLYKLSESPIRSAALANLTLLRSVVEFKERFYYSSWARYDLAIPGSFRLSPPDGQLPALERGYIHRRLPELPPSQGHEDCSRDHEPRTQPRTIGYGPLSRGTLSPCR
ncbi:MAG: hypothetical protein JWQ49_5599 [Edaphobacter sp.]|nr:hypothetical protein [Edaphobacter sp.]